MSRETLPPSGEPRTLQWQEAVRVMDRLQPGDLVQGFEEPSELDLFVCNIGNHLRDQAPVFTLPPTELTREGRSVYEGWQRKSVRPSEALVPQYFLGRLANLQATLIGEIDEGTRFPRLGWVLSADLVHSNGVVRGTVVKECLVGTAAVPAIKEAGLLYIHPPIKKGPTTAVYRTLKESTAEEAVRNMVATARTNAHQRIQRELGRRMLGGSPGLGKHK